ncbi:hypothetical protein [Microbispora sp. H10949]|uniref:hypothetical protein n=1 Tax=Microbispora sp. H10949 TaxID=2729111 RepID=UPI0016009941|nr:hypothetical protein [Microbispora sp. H10949]
MDEPKARRTPRRESFGDSREWLAWSGEMGDLQRIGRIIEDLYEKRQNAIASEVRRQEYDERREEGGSNQNTIGEFTVHAVHSTVNYIAPPAVDDIFEYPFLGLIIASKRKIWGDMDDILTEVDRRSVKKLIFVGAMHPGDRVVVTFSREDAFAVKLEVASTDVGWAHQAFARLMDEIEKGVPRWEFILHRGFGYIWPRALATLLLAAAVTAAFYDKLKATTNGLSFIFFASFLVFIFTSSSDWFTRWLFPKFEILGEGAPSTATRRLGLIFGIAVSIPIGIMVNWIS